MKTRPEPNAAQRAGCVADCGHHIQATIGHSVPAWSLQESWRHGLGSTRQAISQHLEVLEEAGLVGTRRDGRYKLHSINTEPLREITDRWR
jgi:DNA-binding transcriptional ArsR family regulator